MLLNPDEQYFLGIIWHQKIRNVISSTTNINFVSFNSQMSDFTHKLFALPCFHFQIYEIGIELDFKPSSISIKWFKFAHLWSLKYIFNALNYFFSFYYIFFTDFFIISCLSKSCDPRCISFYSLFFCSKMIILQLHTDTSSCHWNVKSRNWKSFF